MVTESTMFLITVYEYIIQTKLIQMVMVLVTHVIMETLEIVDEIRVHAVDLDEILMVILYVML